MANPPFGYKPEYTGSFLNRERMYPTAPSYASPHQPGYPAPYATPHQPGYPAPYATPHQPGHPAPYAPHAAPRHVAPPHYPSPSANIYPSLNPSNRYPGNHGTTVIRPGGNTKFPHHPTGFVWARSGVNYPFPHNAYRGGQDQDGTQIYVGRAHHEGDLLPAKVIPEKNIAYVSHNGREIMKYEYEVLCVGELQWEFASNGMVPSGAVPGGHTRDGEPLYIGRVFHEGSQTVGKVHPSNNCCYIPFAGDEISFPTYEVLVYK